MLENDLTIKCRLLSHLLGFVVGFASEVLRVIRQNGVRQNGKESARQRVQKGKESREKVWETARGKFLLFGIVISMLVNERTGQQVFLAPLPSP